MIPTIQVIWEIMKRPNLRMKKEKIPIIKAYKIFTIKS